MTACALTLCDGSGLIEEPDFTGSVMVRCACRATRDSDSDPAINVPDWPAVFDQEMPAEVAERLALVVDGEAKARRRAQELINRSYNGGLYW